MRRTLLLISIVVLAALWFAFKDMAYASMLRWGEPVEQAEPVFSETDDWAIKPSELPPGAWETPWGIDAFVVLPPSNIVTKHGLLPIDSEAVVTSSLNALTQLSQAIPGETPVYAPFYRAPSPSNDLMVRLDLMEFSQLDISAAFEHYLATANRGRGFILLVSEDATPFVAPLLERTQQDDLVSRFSGLVIFGESDNSALYASLTCAGVLDGACHQDVPTRGASNLFRFLVPNVGEAPTGTDVIDAEGVADAIRIQAKTVSTWLDETQPKPVEPFFATEVISAAPVYSVGETPPDETKEEEDTGN